MSNWTHVAAIVRLNCFTENPYEVFGKECLWESGEDVWEDRRKHPESYLPMGSEGSLQMTVWENPDKSSIANAMITIFGDLRDHNDAEEIVDWFKNKIKDLWVRQATITVENEIFGTVNWTWGYKEGTDDKS